MDWALKICHKWLDEIFGTKNPTKEERKQYIRLNSEINKSLKNEFPCCKYARSDIREKVIIIVEELNNAMMVSIEKTKKKTEKILDYSWGSKKMKYMKEKNTQ